MEPGPGKTPWEANMGWWKRTGKYYEDASITHNTGDNRGRNCKPLEYVLFHGKLNHINAARIVACVNACAGKDPEEMRRQAEVMPLLLKACKAIIKKTEVFDCGLLNMLNLTRDFLDSIRETIALAEKKG